MTIVPVTPAAGPGDELVDIVDEHDNVIATVTRREMRAPRLRHRAVYIAVQHTDGRLLVHQRSHDKDVRPGAWDIAVGGVSAVATSVFDGIDYVALGHLHGRHTLTDSVRYSGSPLAYSFSEAGHRKAGLRR